MGNPKKAAKADLKGVVIAQSNHITKAKYDYSLAQQRLFTWIMYHLQVYIRQVINGTAVKQLDLFAAQQVSSYIIEIPLYHLSTPAHYNNTRTACEQMVTTAFVMLDKEKKVRRVTGLIASVETKYDGRERVDTMRVEMRRDVIEMLISVDQNTLGKGNNYTQYHMYVVMNARNKYTAKVYMLLSKWKDQQGFKITLQEFRELLQIPQKSYRNYNDLKRFVLLPVQKELKEMADIWFNAADKEFTIYDKEVSKKVSGLNFKIIRPMTEQILKNKIDSVFYMIKTVYSGKPYHYDTIRHLLHNETNWDTLKETMERCYRYIQENNVPQYAQAKYVVNSIIKDLSPV